MVNGTPSEARWSYMLVVWRLGLSAAWAQTVGRAPSIGAHAQDHLQSLPSCLTYNLSIVSLFFFFTILLICINRQSSGASTVICSVLTARTTLSLPCVHAYIDTQRWTWKFHWYVWRRWIYEKKQLGRYNQISSVIGRKKKVKSLICWCPRRVVDGISSTRTVHSGKFTMFLSFQENTIHSSLQKSR